MADEILQCVEIDPQAQPSGVVIWLHGLGADGHDFEPIVPELKLPDSLPLRFVFPHAPRRPVTINQGMVMRAWYDILDLSLERKVDIEHLLQSAGHLERLITREIDAGMPSERIVVAGFSQGGAIALYTGLRYPQQLAGILGLSTYMPTAASLEEERSQANRDTLVMMAHGTMDPLVPVHSGQAARDELKRLGYDVSWHTYPMAHQVCMEEIDEIGAWLRNVLG